MKLHSRTQYICYWTITFCLVYYNYFHYLLFNQNHFHFVLSYLNIFLFMLKGFSFTVTPIKKLKKYHIITPKIVYKFIAHESNVTEFKVKLDSKVDIELAMVVIIYSRKGPKVSNFYVSLKKSLYHRLMTLKIRAVWHDWNKHYYVNKNVVVAKLSTYLH